METKHYVCTGSCEGKSATPGVCNADDCEKHGESLKECVCTDETHTEARKD